MIEITPRIEDLLIIVPEAARSEVLKRAWAACCDGAAMAAHYPHVDFDPWDGRHEEKRRQIEEFFVYSVINLADFF